MLHIEKLKSGTKLPKSTVSVGESRVDATADRPADWSLSMH